MMVAILSRASVIAAAFLFFGAQCHAIVPNDNARPAGRLDHGVQVVRLVAGVGTWRPEGDSGVPLEVAAFGEGDAELSTPGPLIRVVQGTTVEVTLDNRLARELRVFGLCPRPGKCEPVTVAAGASREVSFLLDAPGTYHYWASSDASTPANRARFETQLGGAIVVDPPGPSVPDRVFVISIYGDPVPLRNDPRQVALSSGEGSVFAINGASWPHTERLRYAIGERPHWRIVNLSNIGHAMHLHGFHFELESTGDGITDRAQGTPRTEVTQFIGPGRTFALSWTPTRPGNWLFHCHMLEHMSARAWNANGHGHDHAGMAGLVLGIEITGTTPAAAPEVSPTRFKLVLRQDAHRYGSQPGYRMSVEGANAPRLDPGPVPGPVLVLQRGQPVEIEVVNRLPEPTAIHWHGIELDSYYDGVPNFGGVRDHVAPPIAPGTSFVAKFTPPRAGTFIYHTHWHDDAQLAGGLYGALLVLEPGETYEPSVDHVIVIGLNGVLKTGAREPFALNGRDVPAPIRLRSGVPNRLRIINITANNDALSAFLLDRFELAKWTPIAKDGAALPAEERRLRPAQQLVSVGETYDFQIDPMPPQNLWLEIRRASGEWVLQAPVVIR